mmetsp:Transcript_6885/g.13544  ORF Transcript_6885/g.13544 Transcript_6885/m.13544 type:complete len:205 (+) Transcript_6885:478-1092(+)
MQRCSSEKAVGREASCIVDFLEAEKGSQSRAVELPCFNRARRRARISTQSLNDIVALSGTLYVHSGTHATPSNKQAENKHTQGTTATESSMICASLPLALSLDNHAKPSEPYWRALSLQANRISTVSPNDEYPLPEQPSFRSCCYGMRGLPKPLRLSPSLHAYPHPEDQPHPQFPSFEICVCLALESQSHIKPTPLFPPWQEYR